MIEPKTFSNSNCPNVSTTPSTQWFFWQYLPFNWTALRGKHCQAPHCCNGSSDTSSMVKHLCKSKKKNSSNNRVVMLKGPLQYTCNQHDNFVIWQVIWELKEVTCHPTKGFSVRPLCDFTRSFIHLFTFMNFAFEINKNLLISKNFIEYCCTNAIIDFCWQWRPLPA